MKKKTSNLSDDQRERLEQHGGGDAPELVAHGLWSKDAAATQGRLPGVAGLGDGSDAIQAIARWLHAGKL